MSAAKPCLGYPSRTAAALALKQRGYSLNEIAAKIGISPQTVGALLSSAKRRKDEQQISIQTDTLTALLKHASRRKIPVHELARQLIETAVEDDLVDAIMDDTPCQGLG